MRILIVEDNERLGDYMEKGLKQTGFAIDRLETLSDAAIALGSVRYDAVILDLGMPDGDGRSLLADIRRSEAHLPVLILTARDQIEDRVDGLNRGADDYMLKPFAMEELIARIRALLRRPGGALGITLQVGNIRFDSVGREVMIDGENVILTRREMDVLEHLMRRCDRVVPKTVLEESVYGFGEEIGSNSIEVAIHRLRKNLSAANASVDVHTLRGVGYLLTESQTETS